MDEELKGRMTKYLDGLEKAAGKVGEFAETEIPETIREWIRWFAVEHSIYALSFLVVSAVIFLNLRRVTRWCIAEGDKEESSYYRDNLFTGQIFARLGMWVIPGLFMIGFVVHGLDVLKALTAPRVLVIEKMAELIKPKGK